MSVKQILDWVGEHPILTFFLLALVFSFLVEFVKAFK